MAPAKHCGEGKQQDRDGDEHRAEGAKYRGKGLAHQGGTGSLA